jgi:hypothetical protein
MTVGYQQRRRNPKGSRRRMMFWSSFVEPRM